MTSNIARFQISQVLSIQCNYPGNSLGLGCKERFGAAATNTLKQLKRDRVALETVTKGWNHPISRHHNNSDWQQIQSHKAILHDIFPPIFVDYCINDYYSIAHDHDLGLALFLSSSLLARCAVG